MRPNEHRCSIPQVTLNPMIVDVHSHYFEYPKHFSPAFIQESVRGRNREIDLTVRWEEYARGATMATPSVVFGGKAKLAGLWVPDDEVAAYVATQPGRLIGYLSLDPTQPGWEDELRHGHQHLKLKGIKLMPMYAGFYPNSRALDPLWEYAT